MTIRGERVMSLSFDGHKHRLNVIRRELATPSRSRIMLGYGDTWTGEPSPTCNQIVWCTSKYFAPTGLNLLWRKCTDSCLVMHTLCVLKINGPGSVHIDIQIVSFGISIWNWVKALVFLERPCYTFAESYHMTKVKLSIIQSSRSASHRAEARWKKSILSWFVVSMADVTSIPFLEVGPHRTIAPVLGDDSNPESQQQMGGIVMM